MIEVKKVKKAFDKHIIFSDFSLKIKTGEMVAITGASGSGKSTLLNMIGLLDNDYNGTILYDGENIKEKNNKKKQLFIRNKINYLFQNYALVDEETVEYNLLLAMKYLKISKKEKEERIKKVLEEVGLSSFEKKKIFSLSGGEQQRVALARAMLKQGNIILADEPTGNLDYKNSSIVMKILKKLQNDGKTIIVVTHSEDVAKSCDRVINI